VRTAREQPIVVTMTTPIMRLGLSTISFPESF